MRTVFKKSDFFSSLLCVDDHECFISLQDFFIWLKKRRDATNVLVEQIPFSSLSNWTFNKQTGDLSHTSGKFFTIQGIEVKTNFGIKSSWQQPIINQPEIGILGIISKKINGVLHFLMQAKVEPGNINFVQLSPTLQATKSNYTMVHGGAPPLYLQYFLNKDESSVRTLVDQLQSEQGARFLKKRNRNVIIEVLDDIEVHDNFIWLTLGQLKSLLKYPNVVNMDTRTVISSITYGTSTENHSGSIGGNIDETMILSISDNSTPLYSMDSLIAWIAALKSKYELEVYSYPLNAIEAWRKNDMEINHVQSKYFKIIALDVSINNREVKRWSQPIVQSVQEGIIGFLIKEINGVNHFLVQAKVEAGNFDILELAPTVQCLTGNYREGLSEYEVPFLSYFTANKSGNVIYSVMQSEEGGRFFREQNLNVIIKLANDFDETSIPENYIWMTLKQLMEFGRYNNYLNIQTRSLLSAIDFKLYG